MPITKLRPACSRVAVLGGGVSGLTALYRLAQARRNGAPVEEFLIEAQNQAGGLIRTDRVQDFVIEAGPDSFLTEKSAGIKLAEELGLGKDLLGSCDEPRRTYILHHNRLVPLPDGMKLFVPRRLGPVLTSPLLSFSSRLAVLRDAFWSWPVAPRVPNEPDVSVASFVRRHFGKGMLETIAAPLMAGIYGGDSEQLSARSALSGLYHLEQQYGSLRRGLLKESRNAPSSRPLFTTLRGGMEQLIEALVRSGAGDSRAGRLHLGQRITGIEAASNFRAPSRKYTIHCQNGECFEADAVILALPASECAQLLRPVDSTLADDLAAIPYAPAATITLGYSAGLAAVPAGSGFLAPRNSRRRLLACTFVHSKFPFRAPRGETFLRCFYGGVEDAEAARLSEDQLAALAERELRDILRIAELPGFVRVYRWPLAMPQYVVGHKERVKRIWAAIGKHPGLLLAGGAYSGVGISDCIRMAHAAVEGVLEYVLAVSR